jgi:hypothetical protein
MKIAKPCRKCGGKDFMMWAHTLDAFEAMQYKGYGCGDCMVIIFMRCTKCLDKCFMELPDFPIPPDDPCLLAALVLMFGDLNAWREEHGQKE